MMSKLQVGFARLDMTSVLLALFKSHNKERLVIKGDYEPCKDEERPYWRKDGEAVWLSLRRDDNLLQPPTKLSIAFDKLLGQQNCNSFG